jgi:hypothetical protein
MTTMEILKARRTGNIPDRVARLLWWTFHHPHPVRGFQAHAKKWREVLGRSAKAWREATLREVASYQKGRYSKGYLPRSWVTKALAGPHRVSINPEPLLEYRDKNGEPSSACLATSLFCWDGVAHFGLYQHNPWGGRRFCQPFLQGIPKEIRPQVFPGLFDYDISNCMPTILDHLFDSLGHIADWLAVYCEPDGREQLLEVMTSRYGCTRKEAKEFILATMNLCNLDSTRKKSTNWEWRQRYDAVHLYTLRALQDDVRRGLSALQRLHPDIAEAAIPHAKRKKKSADAVFLSWTLQMYENRSLEAVEKHVLVPMFDGFLSDQDLSAEFLSEHVHDATGFHVRWRKKRLPGSYKALRTMRLTRQTELFTALAPRKSTSFRPTSVRNRLVSPAPQASQMGPPSRT